MENPHDVALRDLRNVIDELIAHPEYFEGIDDIFDDANQSPVDRNVRELKSRIDNFLQEHPDIVNNIGNYFYNDFLMYILRRAFDPSFTSQDITQMQNLFNRFFREHEENIKTIYSYFFNHLTPFIKSKYLRWIPMYIQCKIITCILKRLGVTYLTSLMYPNRIEPVQNQERHSLSILTYFLLLLFFIILCRIIFIQIISFLFFYFVKSIGALFVFCLCVMFYNYHH
jgi:hypothetical protein